MKKRTILQELKQIDRLHADMQTRNQDWKKSFDDFFNQLQVCYRTLKNIPPFSMRKPLTDLQHALNALMRIYRLTHKSRKFRRGRALAEIFIPGAKMNFLKLCSELHRCGFLDNDNTLAMKGSEIRSLYHWLVRERIVTPLDNMTDVLYAFQKSFKLNKSERSLQGIRDTEENINAWDYLFVIKQAKAY